MYYVHEYTNICSIFTYHEYVHEYTNICGIFTYHEYYVHYSSPHSPAALLTHLDPPHHINLLTLTSTCSPPTLITALTAQPHSDIVHSESDNRTNQQLLSAEGRKRTDAKNNGGRGAGQT